MPGVSVLNESILKATPTALPKQSGHLGAKKVNFEPIDSIETSSQPNDTTSKRPKRLATPKTLKEASLKNKMRQS